jgi:prepilin-type N-terminal cleavage/methylation domain-containing protein
MKTFKPPGSKSLGAFSLIELLSVMAIIGMMTAAAIPALNSIKGGGSLTKTAFDISGVLEQARSYAMANNTYVFVGIAEVDATNAEAASGQQPGTGRVVVFAAGSKDGTRSFGTGNSNLVGLTRLLRFDNAHLDAASPNSGNMSRPTVADGYRVANPAFAAENSFQWPLSGGAANYTFTKIIQFDPRGAASLQSSARTVPQWLEIGLAPARGTVALVEANRAALLLDGVTGSVKIYRP